MCGEFPEKRQYIERIYAENALRSMRAKGNKTKLQIYRCLSCGHWHLGAKGTLTRQEHREKHRWQTN